MQLDSPLTPGGAMAISRRNFIAGSVAGAAILGNGNVSLILDLPGLIDRAYGNFTPANADNSM